LSVNGGQNTSDDDEHRSDTRSGYVEDHCDAKASGMRRKDMRTYLYALALGAWTRVTKPRAHSRSEGIERPR
jgi:hypothetical protein